MVVVVGVGKLCPYARAPVRPSDLMMKVKQTHALAAEDPQVPDSLKTFPICILDENATQFYVLSPS